MSLINTQRHAIVATQAILIVPAILFMVALILRQMSQLQHEPAYMAQQIVMWYAGRMWTLWVLLITLPLVVVVIGCLTLLRSWSKGRELRSSARKGADATPSVSALTLAAGIVLAIVAVHIATN